MEVSDVWLLFGSYIHQDFLISYPDFFSGISEVLKNFTPEEKKDLHIFLKKLVEEDFTDKQRLEIWLDSGAQFSTLEKDIYGFLSEILKEVEKSRA